MADAAFSRNKTNKKWKMAITYKAAGKRIQRYFATELEVRRLRDCIALSSESLSLLCRLHTPTTSALYPRIHFSHRRV